MSVCLMEKCGVETNVCWDKTEKIWTCGGDIFCHGLQDSENDHIIPLFLKFEIEISHFHCTVALCNLVAGCPLGDSSLVFLQTQFQTGQNFCVLVSDLLSLLWSDINDIFK